ncbi:MAG TPA: Rad52/Rad22 family DNA repair protein [Bacilli bacterium]|nr:Rad52/Rad22 family DNA repair protein [Bacilli bacterium]
MTKETIESKLDIKKLYDELSKPLDKKAIQRSKSEDTKKGYDTTGYGYQFIVNRFNEVLGIGGWNWSFEEVERAEGTYKSGTKFVSITGKATIVLNLPNGQVVSHSEYGGHQSSNLTDALKGASTNALKKTAAFFGVGKDAFEGSIDEDNQDQPEVKKPAIAKREKDEETKTTLNETLLMIDSIKDTGTLEQWKKKLETSKTLNDIHKRVIEARLEKRLEELKEI